MTKVLLEMTLRTAIHNNDQHKCVCVCVRACLHFVLQEFAELAWRITYLCLLEKSFQFNIVIKSLLNLENVYKVHFDDSL